MPAVGTFTVVMDVEVEGVPVSGRVTVKFQHGADYFTVGDLETMGRFARSGNQATAVSANYELELPTDVPALGSAADSGVGYDLLWFTKDARVPALFPAQPADSVVYLSDLAAAPPGIVATPDYAAQAIAARDEAVAAAASLNPSLFVTKGSVVVNALDHGVATGNTATANTSALNAIASTLAASTNDPVLLIPAGSYNINGAGVTIRCALEADQATLVYTGTGTALTVGHATATTFRRRYNLPRVKKAARTWSDGAIGVQLRNLNSCQVWVPNVENFDYGLMFYGDTTGCVHNTVTLGTIWQCMKSLTYDASTTGWANQNTVLGGRLQQTFQVGMTDEDVNSWQVKIGVEPTVFFNGNAHYGTSFEGDNPGFYRVIFNGAYNSFRDCRWENFGGPSRVYWGNNGYRNIIDGGYDAFDIVETAASTANISNEIRDSQGAYIEATAVAALSIPTSAWTARTWSTQTSKRAGTYNAGLGIWTPRAGRWRISGAVLFAASTSGTRRMARLIAAGANVIATAQNASLSASQTTQVAVTGTYRFNGSESLALQAWQDTGADLALGTTAGYSYLYAERIGP